MIWPLIGIVVAVLLAVVVGAFKLHEALSKSRKDADAKFGTTPVGCATLDCPRVIWVWDDPVVDRRQYVNLPAAWDPPKVNGKQVELVGHVEPRLAGQNVTFNIVPNPANEPDTPPASLSVTSIATEANGIGRVTITLPHYGGSKFKVGGKTVHQAQPVHTGELWVWRKVFYQTTAMVSSPAPENLPLGAPADMIPALTSAFDPVFFELAASAKAADTTPYQAHLTAAQRTTLEGTLRGTAADARSPYKMNIVMCDRADIVAELEWANAATAAAVETPYFQRWVYETTVIRAQYEGPPGTWSDLTGAAPEAHPTDATFERVTATIPAFAAGSTVNVRVKYRSQRGTAGGWGGTTGTLFMCIGNQRRTSLASPTGAELQQALTHEIGHALSLVGAGESWIDTDPRDEAYSLRHCGNKDTAATPEPRCVMWFMLGGSGARLRFCSSDRPNDCAHFLYRTDYAGLGWI